MKRRRATTKVGGSIPTVLTKSDLEPIIAVQKILLAPPKPTVIQKIYLERESLFPFINKVKGMLDISGTPVGGIRINTSKFFLTRYDLRPVRNTYNKFTAEERTTVRRIIPPVLSSLWNKIISTPKPGQTGALTRSDIEPIVEVQQILSGVSNPGPNFIKKIFDQINTTLKPLIEKLTQMVKFTIVYPSSFLGYSDPSFSYFLDGASIDISTFSLTKNDIMPLRSIYYSCTQQERSAITNLVPSILGPLFDKIVGPNEGGTEVFLTQSDINPIVAVHNIILGVPKLNFLQKTIGQGQLVTLLPLMDKVQQMIKVEGLSMDYPTRAATLDVSKFSLTVDDLAPIRNIYATFTVEEKNAILKLIPPVFSRLWNKIVSS
jgi:hypothetical protein